MANKVQKILSKKFNPDGFNVGININKQAGQSRTHTAIHVIPRYKGDAAGNKGGIRSVIPKSEK
jgi:diadenosine tetraphosphate (Ap4A) HIT family hydrolase